MTTKKALLVIDMQKGSFTEQTPRHDTNGVVERINQLSAKLRSTNDPVIFIQHNGEAYGQFIKHTREWELLDDLQVDSKDLVVDKYANDSFYNTELQTVLDNMEINTLLISGCATDFCVESTVQSALTKDFSIIIISDAHTTGNRPGLTAEQVIAHYNWVWSNMTPTKGKIDVKSCEDVLKEL